MIETNNNQNLSCFGMPVSARGNTSVTRAFPIVSGAVAATTWTATGVDVMGTAVLKHREFAGNAALSGTSTWSPPT